MPLIDIGTSTVNSFDTVLGISAFFDNVEQIPKTSFPKDSIEINSPTTIPWDAFSYIENVSNGGLYKQGILVDDITGPTTVPQAAVGSILPITQIKKNSLNERTNSLTDILQAVIVTTDTIYNAGNLPVVPLSPLIRNYRPTPIISFQTNVVPATVFTTTFTVINQTSSRISEVRQPSLKTDYKLQPTRTARLTVKTSSTTITAYSYWV